MQGQPISLWAAHLLRPQMIHYLPPPVPNPPAQLAPISSPVWSHGEAWWFHSPTLPRQAVSSLVSLLIGVKAVPAPTFQGWSEVLQMPMKYSEQGLAQRVLRRSGIAFPPRALNLISFHSLLVCHRAPVLNSELRKGSALEPRWYLKRPWRRSLELSGAGGVGGLGIPWQSSAQDSMLPPQGAWVWFLVRELRSYMPHGSVKRERRKERKKGKEKARNCGLY